ncbi:MAG: autotransporter-associated beta strand repeat-containing protein [Bacteroidaceae bacterium]|nr:autotransporter-associated beta strand repeat-containing protein [Bacteroidaceae bacterium]
MKRLLSLLCALCLVAATATAQRKTDVLDRGLVAVPANVNGGSGSGNFVSWKIFGEEYYDVTYNLYANGKLLKGGLTVGCFSHTAGNASTKYQVAAVINGVEQELSAEVTRWEGGYKDIMVAKVTDRTGADATSTYELNDISLGDVTGNGIPEFIVKRNYTGGVNDAANKTRFHLYECYTLDGRRLWSIDLGPNLMAGPDEQWDLVAFDWDEDGKAECIMRGADNMIIHTATGHDIQIGKMNYYAPRDEYTREGAEYLLYLNGETGEPFDLEERSTFNSQLSTFNYSPMAYPLPRFETGESDYATVWGKNDTGHRATKHYFGAPFLDGRHASIFLGRGCYTRHKMCALDVDPATHKLTQRWRWNEYSGSSPYFGQGFHNFAIGDVDWDGRDEIIFGSMIIDDNGKGLCTTGLGHGDAQHCADLDPYRHGNEQFTCNETSPACTYYNATTGKYYYRLASTGDDGRALAGNFSNAFPGSMGRSTQSGLISLTADKVIEGGPATGGTNDALYWSHLNQRIYWDGDLCDEVMDSPGSAAREGAIYKPGGGRLFTTSGCNTSNSSKNNPGAIADIFGDWREELVMRAESNTRIRIWTTAIPTTYRIYTLWHDHQYRNAMVWQCVGYNQPPHKSYFLGQMEGITVAPPPLTTTGRVIVPDGSAIGSKLDGQHLLVCETANTALSVQDGAAPAIATFNVPSWVQGTNSTIVNGTAKVNTTRYTCTVTGGAFTGAMRLVKQGDGILTLPAVNQTYTGPTDIWAGTVNFDGQLLQSDLWLNRFAELNSNGGAFRSIKMDYASILRPGGEGTIGRIQTDTLALGFGSRVKFDLNVAGDERLADCVAVRGISIEVKNWNYGPQYLAPVFEFAVPKTLDTEALTGRYLIAEGVKYLKGNLKNIVIEGLGTTLKSQLVQEEENIYLEISGVRDAGYVVWTGAESTTWEFGGEANFNLLSTQPDETGTADSFVSGDRVLFDDSAKKFTVALKGDIVADSIIVDATKNYTFNGTGAITGTSKLIKRGTGTLTVQNDNTYTGGTRISGGVLAVTSLSNENQAAGNLGGVTTAAQRFIIENGAELRTTAAVTMGSPMQIVTTGGGVINNSADFVVNKAISGTTLTKKGTGWMKMNTASTLQRFIVAAGTVQCVNANKVANTLEFQGGTYSENTGSNFTIYVAKGKTGTWNTANRASYTNKITGEGTLTIYCEEEVTSNYAATRTQLGLDFRDFEGTIKAVGNTNDSGPRWTLNTANGLSKGTLDIAAGLTVQNTAKTFAIGKLTGTGKLGGWASFSNNGGSGANTWRVGNNSDWSWGGTVTADSKLIKTGTGKVTLSGASDHTGATTVEAGELCLKSGAQLGTGALTVSRGATLSGVTTAAAPLNNPTVTVSAGATLQVGTTATATSGMMNFGGNNVTLANGSVLSLGASRGATGTSTGGSSLQNINKLTINASIEVYVPASQSFAVGDSILLWKNVTTVSGKPTLATFVIDAEQGLFWDDTDIASGILRVTDVVPVGIREMADDQMVNGKWLNGKCFDLQGRPVAKPRHGHTYIINGRKVRF